MRLGGAALKTIYCAGVAADSCSKSMNLPDRNLHSDRIAAWIAVAAVLFGVWLAPACAFMCAAPTPGESSHCHHNSGEEHRGAAKSEDHDCRTGPCSNLQSAVQTDLQPQTVPTGPVSVHPQESSVQATAQATRGHRPWLPSMALGPPVPPSRFTILRS